MDVQRVIADHMKFADYYPPGYTSAEQYIQAKRMDRFGTWGTDTEMVTFASAAALLQSSTYMAPPIRFFPLPVTTRSPSVPQKSQTSPDSSLLLYLTCILPACFDIVIRSSHKVCSCAQVLLEY